MNNAEKTQVRTAIDQGLNRAESNWNKVGHLLKAKQEMSMEGYAMDSANSNIPGHTTVAADKPEVDEFIALVVDMRGSTQRLNTFLSYAKVNNFQRIYYETSALLPAIAVTCSFQGGVVTEYLGDGALILFKVNKEDRVKSVKQAYRAAKNCINDTRQLINEAIRERYNLPDLSLGAGLAISQAMITLVGAPENYQPKAVGTCVWDASKLSGGLNTVQVSDDIRLAWPTSKGGRMRFKRLELKYVKGYKMHELQKNE